MSLKDFYQSNNLDLIGKSKYIRLRRTSQLFDLIDPQVDPEIAKDIVSFISSMSNKALKVLNNMFYWSATTGVIYIRQDTLARYAGYCRQTVNELLGKFQQWGFILSNYRHKTSCLYKVSSFFNDFKIRSLLKPFLSSLAFFPICLLNRWIEEKATQYNSINLLISNQIKSRSRVLLNVRERARNIEGEVVIKQYVEEIQNPELTHQEKVSLSQYSEGAVRHALIQVQRSKDLRNPVGFMIACCKSFDAKSSGNSHSYNRNHSDSVKKKEVVINPNKKTIVGNSTGVDCWKTEYSKLAHRDIVDFTADLERGKRFGLDYLADIMLDRYKKALEVHDKNDCYLCSEFGPTYIYYPTTLGNSQGNIVTNPTVSGYTAATPVDIVPIRSNGQQSIRDLLKEQFKGAV